jgi:hypothetical protein
MLELVGLFFYARYLGRRTFSKGFSKGRGIGIAVGFWLGFELLAGFIGSSFALASGYNESSLILVTLPFAVSGIGISILISLLMVRALPVRREEIIERLNSRAGTDDDWCLYVKGLASLGQSALPVLEEFHDRELNWPRSDRFRQALSDAISKLRTLQK